MNKHLMIKSFQDVSRGDALIAGGKGASLGEMTRAGIPVPPGFVVVADTFDTFLAETDVNVEIETILHSEDTEKMHTVEYASERIKKLILDAEIPKDMADAIQEQFTALDADYVAVRSSATAEDSDSAAWAGQLDSFLNTTKENLLENVKKCWASLFTPRAIFYRFEKGLHTSKISVAVVIQKMIQSEVSGITFSVHPVTEDRNQMIIEAGYGLGEAIVSGQITPDSYVVEKEPRSIVDKNVVEQTRGIFQISGGGNVWKNIPEDTGKRQKLSDEQILELAELIIRIEQHYGFPCDIEWAYTTNPEESRGSVGAFYIVQSRPITTLNAIENKEDKPPFFDHYAWSKNWEAPFSLLACEVELKSFPGFDAVFGAPLVPVMIHKKGFSSCYFTDEQLDTFSLRLWELYKKKPESLEQWIVEGCHAADRLKKLVKAKDPLESLEAVVLCADTFGAPNFAIKEIANHFSAKNNVLELEKVTEYRKYTELFYFNVNAYLSKVITIVADRSGYVHELVQSFTLAELFSYIREGKLPVKEILWQRYEKSVAWYVATGFTFYEGSPDGVIRLVQGAYDHSGSFRGVKAYGGKATGKVKKIIVYDASVTVGEDDILVTGMTDPRFIRLVRMARAFVTDAGGMLSHAAVVAREYQKPCIIGTKIATEALQDGDLVEVDATKGIVKILKGK